MSYCTKCGKAIDASVAFCTGCGMRLEQNTAAAPSPSQSLPPAANAPVAAVPVAKSGGFGKVLAIAFVVLVLIGGSVAGATYYVYHRVKAKAKSALQDARMVKSALNSPATKASSSAASEATDANAPADRGTDTENSIPTTPPAFPAWNPNDAAPAKGSDTAQASGTHPAPLSKGMLVVTAVADESGDYESFKEVTDTDEHSVTLFYRSEAPKGGNSSTGAASRQETTVNRKIMKLDLDTAHDYVEVFGTNDPSSFPGSTAISASAQVLAELKEKGSTLFSYRPDGVKGVASSLVSTLSGMAGIDPKTIGDGSLAKISKENCQLHRIGDADYSFPVLLNGQPTKMPALHAGCNTDDGVADFYILDQSDYPLMLEWKLGEGSRLQVIKITYPPEPSPKKLLLEEELAENKKVEIYGIYFDFASDHLKPESTPVLDEIAKVMQRHPDWKLSVSGHTDSIGGDRSNLDLSRRRAAAVKQALLSRYHIASPRLTDSGSGASSPIDTNETLEGRARNRRVELVRN